MKLVLAALKCETTHIDNQLKTVKTEPLEGRFDYRSPGENSPTYQQPAVSEKVVNSGSQRGSINRKYLITSSCNQEHTRIFYGTLQGNQVSIGLDTTLQENQESNGLGTTLQGNQESNGTDNHFSASEIKSKIIGRKRVCWNSDRHSGSICSPTFTVAVKNGSIEENCYGSQDNLNKSSSLSFFPECATLTSAASICSNESGSSRICSFAELQDTFGSSGICSPTLNLPALEKKSAVSSTLLVTPFGNTESLSSLHTAETLNSLESSTSIRKVKTEPFEPAVEPSGKNSLESSTFINKAKTEPFVPATEPFQNIENNVSHLGKFRAGSKMEEINEYPLDHISLKDRINSQPNSFLQRTTENLNLAKLSTFVTDAKTQPFEPTIETSRNRECSSYNLDLPRADVKSEKIDEFPLDMIDHTLLKDRLNMLWIRQGSSFGYPMISKDSCTFAELQDTFGSIGICAPTLNLHAPEEKSYVSGTLLATHFGKTESLNSLHTAETLNSLELSTSTRRVKTEPFELGIEPSEKDSLESATFISKAKTEPFELATEPSESRENIVSHLDTLRADIKEEEINELPLDHISLKDRINKLLVSQPYFFIQHTAENLNLVKLPTFVTDAKTQPFEPTIETSKNREPSSYNLDLPRVDVKSEKIDEFPLDVIDHILLKDRLNMLLIRQGSSFDYPMISKYSKTNVPNTMSLATSAVTATITVTASAHQRKRKRTATDSVETALGEDAPELLQALVDQGINIEELKLYEVMDGNDDLIDISDIEDNFTDLGNVISKLFFVRSNSLLKLNSLRDMEGLKASYSLSCLISLIQQAQYLQLRKCPVEWGWCRDLQSFIFVFKKHNRIVLERPEYGYATYFFELIESFPIDWQIKRLVIAMKLTNCSRIALIENKSLMVGQDLTEGEARVLEDYGWRPHTGLASMLNFCDRVVHDRRSEMSLSEWKSKIGKLLMNGYDSGRIVIQDLPRKVVQYMENRYSQSNMEIGTMDFLPFEKQR